MQPGNFITQIVANKEQEVERRSSEVPLREMKERAESQPPALALSLALKDEGVSLIAEVKKASPSKGLLSRNFDPAALARAYSSGGAAAISVLTDSRYFQGSLQHIGTVRAAIDRPLPILRKDFILFPYQIYESRAYGADAILLIVAILRRDRLRQLLSLTRQLEMEALVEVHNQDELELAISCGAEVVGINNRDLRTFQTDTTLVERLRPLIPSRNIVVCESGISRKEQIQKLRELRVHAVLIGEALVTAPDPGAKIRELMG